MSLDTASAQERCPSELNQYFRTIKMKKKFQNIFVKYIKTERKTMLERR